MPIQTNLNTSPYWDDYDPTRDYYKFLFQPGVSVQVRELNQLQTLLQTQIERFGDNIFKRGTIISGCNFAFFPEYAYAKLLDVQVDGQTTIPMIYVGCYAVSDSTGLSAQIINYADGFESSDPDLKTIYMNYLNGGSNNSTYAFSSGEVLKIFDGENSIYKVNVTNGGLNFSNTDTIVVTSAVIANMTSGAFANAEYIRNTAGANVQIIGIDSVTLANSNQVILRLQPRNVDLANSSANSMAWTLSNNDTIVNTGNTVTAVIEGIVGSGFSATVLTNGSGTITSIPVVARGRDYTVVPTVRVRSVNNSSGLTTLDLAAQNYVARVTVASTSNSVGNGYAFAVTTGIIYQKGYFLRVEPQIVIVNNYSSSPDGVSVVFNTREEIINSNIDTSLLDNALGTENNNAPGADRLRLTPLLKVVDQETAETSDQYFPIVSWSEGSPYRQNQNTQYSKINDEMAKRTADSSGNFVTDPFLISTRSPANSSNEAQYYTAMIDPGSGYISGHRVTTSTNYAIQVEKGINSVINGSQSVSLDYDNYINIKNVGGIFQFNTGDVIELYDTAKAFSSNSALILAKNTAPVGTLIGTARIRSLVLDNATYDPSLTTWKLYLFNITMNLGQNFKNVKSVYYNGTNKGIADVVLTLDATTNANLAIITNPNNSLLLFHSGVNSLKNANNITYQYRTIDQTTETANSGLLVKDISATVDEFYPYSGSLSLNQLTGLYVVPTANDLICNVSLTGTVTANVSTANVIGSGTDFLTTLVAGDFVYLTANSTTADMKKVTQVVNNTFLVIDSVPNFTNTATNVYRAFPQYVPVPFGTRSGLSANVDSNTNILTLNFGMRFGAVGSVNTSIGVDIKRVNPTQTSKVAKRNYFVKMAMSNNAGGVNGPWCMGVADVFRLRNVYYSTNSTINTSSRNVISTFYVDHNQNPDFLDLSYLYKMPQSSLNLSSGDYLLVEFDYYTSSGSGFYDTVSYLGTANQTQIFVQDSLPLSNLTTTASSWEIPEVFDNAGNNYDLLRYFDFRPIASNTVAPTTDNATAPLNPGNTLSFGNTASVANEKKFPLPHSLFTGAVEHYLGRIDTIMVNKDGQIIVSRGVPAENKNERFAPTIPNDTLAIADLSVPGYPSLPLVHSSQIDQIINTRVTNQRYLKSRITARTITKEVSMGASSSQAQPRVYTHADVGKLDRRLRDVEYYVSLSLLESDIKNRIIPSSVDPSLDRFKFGFYADDYSDYKFLDTSNPQMSAYIEDSCLVPEKMSWSIKMQPLGGTGEYIDFKLITQSNATTPASEEPPDCRPDGDTGNILLLRKADNRLTGTGTNIIGDTEVVMGAYGPAVDNKDVAMAASEGGTATLYFYHYDTYSKINVFQGNNLIATTADAVALSNTEKAFVTGPNTSFWFNDQISAYLKDPVISGNTAKYAGKISWSHNPFSGRNYTISVSKGTESSDWRYILDYPVDAETVGCPTDPAPSPSVNVIAEGSSSNTYNPMDDWRLQNWWVYVDWFHGTLEDGPGTGQSINPYTNELDGGANYSNNVHAWVDENGVLQGWTGIP